MRAYVAQVDQCELRQIVAEDALPEEIVGQLLREWSLPPAKSLWAVLPEEVAEAVREELAAGRPRDACGLLLDCALEIRQSGG